MSVPAPKIRNAITLQSRPGFFSAPCSLEYRCVSDWGMCVRDICRLADREPVAIRPIETNNFAPHSLNESVCKSSGKGNI